MESIFDKTSLKVEMWIPPAHIEIKDFSAGYQHRAQHSGEAHIKAFIVSSTLKGLSLIDRQRRNHTILLPLIQNEFHALSMKTLTPDEWAETKE
ncbi:MAG: BolA family protein [Fidelibacterota bacterium]